MRLKVFIFVLLAMLVNSELMAKTKNINLFVGSVKTLKVGEVIRVAVGRDEILGTSILDNGELLLIPRGAGETDLHIWKKGERKLSYRVSITSGNVSSLLQAMRSVFRDFKNVTLRNVGEVIVAEGKVEPDRFELFGSLIDAFPGTISLVTPESVVFKDMIRMDVKVLEVNKNYAKQLGINWDNVIAGPSIGYVHTFKPNGRFVTASEDNRALDALFGTPPVIGFDDSSSYTYTGIMTSLNSMINLLKEDGIARVLAEPSLSTRSGESATFHSGGQYPLAVLNEFGQPVVEMQDYGIQLEINPLSDENGNIISEVSAEMSSIDFSTIVNGVPGMLTRNTKSVINLKSGETMVISGLLKAEDSKAVEKLPFLGDIPILGELFTSKNFTENRSELVILVTPSIVSPGDKIPERLQKSVESLKGILEKTKLEEELLE